MIKIMINRNAAMAPEEATCFQVHPASGSPRVSLIQVEMDFQSIIDTGRIYVIAHMLSDEAMEEEVSFEENGVSVFKCFSRAELEEKEE